MIKLAQLIKQIESFYKNALRALAQDIGLAETYVMPDDPEEEDEGGSNTDLFTESERFDIRDETLFNLFEQFMTTYQEITDTIGEMNPNRIDYDQLNTVAQLIETLNTRGRRITESKQLHVTDEYDEDFDPSELIGFIEKVYLDAKKRANSLSEDFDEIKEHQFEAQFQQEVEERQEIAGQVPEAQEEKWMAGKREAQRRAAQNHREKMQALQKLNPEEWTKWYEAQKTKRHEQYKAMMANPEKATVYRAKAKARRQRWLSELVGKQQKLQAEIPRMPEGSSKKEAMEQLAAINAKLQRFKERQVQDLSTRHTLWNAKNIAGAIQLIKTKTDSALFEAREKARKAVFETSPVFEPLKKAIAVAKDEYNEAAKHGPEAKEAANAKLKAAQTALKETSFIVMRKPEVTSEADKSKEVVDATKAISNMKIFSQMIEQTFFSGIKKKDREAMLTDMAVGDDLREKIIPLIAAGETLIKQYRLLYTRPVEDGIMPAVNYLKTMVGEKV